MVVPKTISGDAALLSPTDVADELGVHRSTVHNWIRDGMLASEMHGAFHAVSRAEIDRFKKLYVVLDPKPETGKPKKKKKRAKKRRAKKTRRRQKKKGKSK